MRRDPVLVLVLVLARARALALVAVFVLAASVAPAQDAPECSEDKVVAAIEYLQSCGLEVAGKPPTCTAAVLKKFSVADGALLGEICKEGTSGTCMAALLERFEPRNVEGLIEMGEACRAASGRCVRDLLRTHRATSLEAIRLACSRPATGLDVNCPGGETFRIDDHTKGACQLLTEAGAVAGGACDDGRGNSVLVNCSLNGGRGSCVSQSGMASCSCTTCTSRPGS